MLIKIREITNAFWDGLEPPPNLYLDEWADEYRILTSSSSSEPGTWRTSRFPYMREPMRLLSPQDPTQEIVMMTASQTAKTELCINSIGYTIHLDPCPIAYYQKTIEATQRFSKQRLPSLELTPEIKDKIKTKKSRDSSNTIMLKSFPGGVLILGGANSAASLRSMPIKKLLLDEIDSFESDIQEEGDPIELAVRRTSNFPDRKILYISTPAIKETSKIEPLFLQGDQRYYFVPCPYCEHKQRIIWKNIKFKIKEVGSSYLIIRVDLECESCKRLIPERYKTWMLENGEWTAQNPGVEMPSFHINSLYSPLGFFSWKDAVRLFLKYKRTRSREHLIVFINTVLGETFSEANKHIDFSMLSSHKKIYRAEVPKEVKVLVAGADVQDDRIEIEILGVGDDLETWSIDYQRFIGDPEFNFVWDKLDSYLMKPWAHESGNEIYLLAAGIDSGHKTKKVYDFCGPREERRIFPLKGKGGWGNSLINRPNRRLKEGVWLYHVSVDEMKSKVYSTLKLNEPGGGYCHFPDKPNYDKSYFKMLTSERLIQKIKNGKKVIKWHLDAGKRNEALDCRVYALAILYVMYPKIELINQISKMISIKPGVKGTRKKRKVISRGI